MKGAQNKKSVLSNWKYILIAVILAFSIVGGVLSYFWNKEKIATVPSVFLTPTTPSSIPIPTPPEEKWETYISDELGFSIKYPRMVYGSIVCPSKKEMIWVPVRVFEDNKNGIVYITQEYYYETYWNPDLQEFTGPCKKIIYTQEMLQEEWWKNVLWDEKNPLLLKTEKTYLGWGILIKNIKNEEELNKFIKENYGSECFVKDKIPKNKISWNQNKVYEIDIGGKDNGEDGINPNCPLHYAYKVLYAPEKNKLVSIKLGQECTFATVTNPAKASETYKCYDEEMIDSFEFK